MMSLIALAPWSDTPEVPKVASNGDPMPTEGMLYISANLIVGIEDIQTDAADDRWKTKVMLSCGRVFITTWCAEQLAIERDSQLRR